eukprot:TRINITY_DN26059_c0_g1_i2.p1 TRINITY_DN26059_c0_g1~~TRINITY_DN26059_c0_g1_i2.p1  ORF type:complete len:699 (+),score=115.15 TRINITY_DN26059_c0_g1_i2:99-2099(+)
MAKAVVEKIEGFDVQDLGNTSWAFATLLFADAPMMIEISKAAVLHASSMAPQNLSNIVWAFATFMLKNDELFGAIAAAATGHSMVAKFNALNLSSVAWAFAKVSICDKMLMEFVCKEALKIVNEWSSQDCANFAWAFAKLGLRKEQLLTAISERSLATIADFSEQSLANLAWAYAMLSNFDRPLFECIATASRKKLSRFSSHDLACISWAFAQITFKDATLLDEISAEVLQRISEFSLEDLAKTSWSWAVLRWNSSDLIVSSWDTSQFLDTAHAFTWSGWISGFSELVWQLINAWSSKGMVFDAATFGLLLMDSAFSKSVVREASLFRMMRDCNEFGPLEDIFEWCFGRYEKICDGPGQLTYAMRFDTRKCLISGRHRGSHFKLARLVEDILWSGANDSESVLEAIRQHSFGEGQWLKVAGGAKANLIEKALRSRPPKAGEVTIECGVFVGFTTIRIGQRSLEAHLAAGRKYQTSVIGLEVEPVHVCVARWMVELAGLSSVVEVWAGIAHDSLLRIGDEFGIRSTRLCFMDHRGTKFHEDLERLEDLKFFSLAARVIADNVLKPSAPVFLWVTNMSPRYETENWSLGEFVQSEAEDWMVVADYKGPSAGEAPPPPPESFLRLAWESDRWRRKSEAESVSVAEWAAFARHARDTYKEVGIQAQPWLN